MTKEHKDYGLDSSQIEDEKIEKRDIMYNENEATAENEENIENTEFNGKEEVFEERTENESNTIEENENGATINSDEESIIEGEKTEDVKEEQNNKEELPRKNRRKKKVRRKKECIPPKKGVLSRKRKIGIIIGLIVLVVGGSLTTYKIKADAEYRKTHFPKVGARISGIDVSDMTKEEAYKKVVDSIDTTDQEIVITYKKNEVGKIVIPNRYDLDRLKREINVQKKVMEIPEKEKWKEQVTEIVDNVELPNTFNVGKDAEIYKDNEEMKFKIAPHNAGEDVEVDKVRSEILGKALGRDNGGQGSKKAEEVVDIDNNVKDNTVHEDNKELVARAKELNDLIKKQIYLEVNNKNYEIPVEVVYNSVELDGSVSSQAYVNWINELEKRVSSVGKELMFNKTEGGELKFPNTVSKGWGILTAETSSKVAESLKNSLGNTQDNLTVEAVLFGNVKDNLKITGTYAEIDMDKQHMWVYKDNKLISSTDIVTGYPSSETKTNVGLFTVGWKQAPSVLKGVNGRTGKAYETPVSYWIQFDGGIGIHDATWQPAFGGELYKSVGSNGCVNTPLSEMPKIYDALNVGDYVVVYGNIY